MNSFGKGWFFTNSKYNFIIITFKDLLTVGVKENLVYTFFLKNYWNKFIGYNRERKPGRRAWELAQVWNWRKCIAACDARHGKTANFPSGAPITPREYNSVYRCARSIDEVCSPPPASARASQHVERACGRGPLDSRHPAVLHGPTGGPEPQPTALFCVQRLLRGALPARVFPLILLALPAGQRLRGQIPVPPLRVSKQVINTHFLLSRWPLSVSSAPFSLWSNFPFTSYSTHKHHLIFITFFYQK